MHPQSVIHSMVEFVDGSTIAQASPPDMRLPIALALGWPDRVPDAAPPVDWTTAHDLGVRARSTRTAFPAVALAKAAGRAGRCRPAIYNAANEECVAAFTAGSAAVHRASSTPSSAFWRRLRISPNQVPSMTCSPPSHGRGHDARELDRGERSRGEPDGVRFGIVLFALGILVSVCLHEAGHMLHGQGLRDEGHPVLRRLRADPVVVPARARPSTASRRSRSAGSSRSSA